MITSLMIVTHDLLLLLSSHLQEIGRITTWVWAIIRMNYLIIRLQIWKWWLSLSIFVIVWMTAMLMYLTLIVWNDWSFSIGKQPLSWVIAIVLIMSHQKWVSTMLKWCDYFSTCLERLLTCLWIESMCKNVFYQRQHLQQSMPIL